MGAVSVHARDMLTIGQLADYVGVTVRAVRHYHQAGLLPEPPRDASGYRRYDATAVVQLIRIKTLADAGVPLKRIAQLVDASPDAFRHAIGEIDAALATRIDDLTDQRRRIAALDGETLFLPPEGVAYLEGLRTLGAAQGALDVERDAWIMLAATEPTLVREWLAEKLTHLRDPVMAPLLGAYYQAFDWSPDDPRLEDIARRLVALAAAHAANAAETAEPSTETAAALISMHLEHASPAWERINELCNEKLGPSAERDTSG